eukprot:TRINITY_DN22209_c0_g1_i1.p1 TRINITY_DN22209_c0_g1~~TRINITY_DN22209_c0_g1_i1.p1  ORF type:complete len:211 (-),score=24.64 TRINITY_DN22209_c0_g1_i1:329-889(-)
MTYGRLPFDVSSTETTCQLLTGRLPRTIWGRTDALTTHLIQQCLTVDGKQRPPALELAQHCLFSDGAADRARSCGRLRELILECTGAADVCHQDSAQLMSCGLIRTETSKGDCSSSILSPCIDLQGELLSKHDPMELRKLSSGFASTLYERCFSDVDKSFKQLAYIKLMRSVCGNDRQTRGLAHTC